LFSVSTAKKILETTCEHKHKDITDVMCELGDKFHQKLRDVLAAGGKGPSLQLNSQTDLQCSWYYIKKAQ
jgi:hypothetical protein